ARTPDRRWQSDSLAHSLVDLLTAHAEPRIALFFSGHRKLERRERRRPRLLPFIFALFKLFRNAWFQERQRSLDQQQCAGWDAYIASPLTAPEQRYGGRCGADLCGRVP